ncbi:6-phosphogluconolactonase [mine drainage metagenome]|uniref:6-phosphogluconolactonase n=1 Tax=mine drainage metagenome TaxID=410659 RepID=A0A1J5QAK6_9ZZZZ
MQTQTLRWRVFDSPADLQAAAASAVLQSANAAIAARGKFLIVLAGGTTPREIYSALRSGDTDWSGWHVYYGDERCLPADHADRNSRMAETSLLLQVGIPAGQIHAIPAEFGPDRAAQSYSELLADVGEFDCVLLGLGEDAHTASLFPGQAWEGATGAPAIAVRNAPKPPDERVSLSASRLSNARQVIFLVTGAGKRDAVRQWRDGADIPVAAIRPATGVEVYIDAAAAA